MTWREPQGVRLDGDRRVMTYIADGRPHTREEVIDFWFPRMRRLSRLYADLGVWRASRRDTGAFVGWFSLKYCGRSSDIEIGYRLVPEAWGQGFATEGAAAMRDYGFDDVGLSRIIGVTHPGNRASQRVLTKIGMADLGWGRYYDEIGDARAAVRETLATTGAALFFTSLVLASGFCVLMAAYMANAFWFGLLASFATVVAFLADVLLGPALMVLVSGGEPHAGVARRASGHSGV